MSLERLKDVFQKGGRPLVCLEVNPPRGVDVDPVFARLEGKLEGVELLNVTDCALARMKCAALPFASLLKQRFGIEPVVNISCRDRNVIAMQADLLAGWVTGIRSIVALTGDAMTVGDSPDRKGVFEINSIGLLNLVATLNSGKDLAGNELKGATKYVPGVVLNPNARNSAAEIKRLRRKQEAGGAYALSQPVFDKDSAVAFFREASAVEMPLLMGLLPLKSLQSAKAIGNVPGIRFPDDLLAKLESRGADTDLSDFFIEHCIDLARAAAPHVAGFHVISGTTPLLAVRLARELAAALKREGIVAGRDRGTPPIA